MKAPMLDSVDFELRPSAIVDAAARCSRADFARELDVPLLLVRLDDASGDLAAALMDVFEHGGVRVEPGIGFHTVTVDRSAAKRPSVRPGPAAFGAEQVQVRLIRAPQFAVPLRKRTEAGKGFTERISVGRARNNDVVLRHESVSKFHAWLTCDEQERYYVADANSHNGTSVNGDVLTQGAPKRLSVGDILRFGSVDAMFCSAGLLWDALHGRGAAT